MKKIIYFLVLCSLTFSFARAEDPVKTEGQAPVAAPCAECGNTAPAPLPTEIVDEAKELLGKLNASFKCTDKSDPKNCLLIDWLKWKHKSYASNCKGFFLDDDGNLGSYSKVIASLIAEDLKQFPEDSIFNKNNSDFTRLCPEFKNFTTTQKIAFHSWIFELLAFPESSCDIKVKPNSLAPTTKAVCMYQLEDRPEIRKWRSNKFNPPRCAVSYEKILTMEGCTGCAFDEYKRKTIKDGTPFGNIDEATGKRFNGSYWASQNPLSKNQQACFEQYFDKKTGRPMMNGKVALYMSKCKDANNEWLPRYKFFKRIQRFPLCGTPAAQEEVDGLKTFQGSATK